jgi:hypothetical protein
MLLLIWQQLAKIFTTPDRGVFFSGEGPHSRHYGRTAAMRLIVQPYDEDGYYFFPFPSNGAPVE